MIRSSLNEHREAIMARFLHGLYSDIRDVVELHNYKELEDLMHHVVKLEQQLKRKSVMRRQGHK